MSDTQQTALADDVRLRFWLRSAGIAAMLGAALGSVLYATPAVPDPPGNDGACRISVVGDQWTGRGCADTDADAAR